MGETGDVVRLVFERLNARDLDGFAALCSPRIEWREVPEIPGASGPYPRTFRAEYNAENEAYRFTFGDFRAGS